jgi:small conductance mechanosensitive channel
VAKDFHVDPAWGKFLLEAPEVLGVNALTDGAMILRLTVKVIPEYQWKIQRELLRRIKLELDTRSIYAPSVTAPVPPPRPS